MKSVVQQRVWSTAKLLIGHFDFGAPGRALNPHLRPGLAGALLELPALILKKSDRKASFNRLHHCIAANLVPGEIAHRMGLSKFIVRDYCAISVSAWS
jgi:hypothetical protein